METLTAISEIEKIISANPSKFGISGIHDGLERLEDIPRRDHTFYSSLYWRVIHRHGVNNTWQLPDWATEPHTKTEAQLFSGDDIIRQHKAETIIDLRCFWFRDNGREITVFIGQCIECSRIIYAKEI